MREESVLESESEIKRSVREGEQRQTGKERILKGKEETTTNNPIVYLSLQLAADLVVYALEIYCSLARRRRRDI